MARKAKGVHTSPATAGAHNIKPEHLEKYKADEETQSAMHKLQHMKHVRKDYGGKWTEDEFCECIEKYFEFCDEVGFEPSKPSLCLWLNVTSETFGQWLKDPKYGFKSSASKSAMQYMESLYFSKLDKRPVPQMFKLKTMFNYIENQKVEVKTTTDVTADEIKERLGQAGIIK